VSDRWKRSAGAVAVLSVAMLVAAGCGSSSKSTGSASSAGSSAASTAGTEAAAAYLAKYTANPTSVGLTTPLPSRAPTGKSVIFLQVPVPVAREISDAYAAAAKVLGWNYSSIGTGATPATAVGAFQAALAKHPDAIIFSGFPNVLFAQQIRQAKEAGIAVVTNTTGTGTVDGVLAELGGAAQAAVYGQLAAAYFVVHSGAKGKAAVFNINAYPILTAFADAFEAAVKQWCPACSTEVQNQQVTDVGTRTPGNVAGLLRRSSSVKWAVFSNGDLAQGVSAAVKAAGLSGINIVGEYPTPANLANLHSGLETAWAGGGVEILGWRTMDTLARHFLNADISGSAAMPLPVQMITTENVAGIAVADGNYIAVAGYQQQFTKLWLEN
jgi:ribose transport system substrate-binding protein